MAKLDWKSVLCNLLDCGFLDLQMLEDSSTDCVLEAIDSLKEEGMEISLNGIIDMMFGWTVQKLEATVCNRISELARKFNEEIVSGEEIEELKAISNLEVNEDIQWYCNYLDTSIYFICDEEKKETYRRYFGDNISKLEDAMGFEILG